MAPAAMQIDSRRSTYRPLCTRATLVSARTGWAALAEVLTTDASHSGHNTHFPSGLKRSKPEADHPPTSSAVTRGVQIHQASSGHLHPGI